jgi:hypothetical protein
MIQTLGGNAASVAAFTKAVGQKITALRLNPEGDGALEFSFESGYRMKLQDDGRSCCESRYMTCDDDLSAYVGAALLGAEVLPAPPVSEDEAHGDCHEVEFLVVTTSAGKITAETHNEHNGYYGGFWVVAKEI